MEAGCTCPVFLSWSQWVCRCLQFGFLKEEEVAQATEQSYSGGLSWDWSSYQFELVLVPALTMIDDFIC